MRIFLILMLSVISFSSGKVELVSEIKNTPLYLNKKDEVEFDFEKELKREYKLITNINENNLYVNTELEITNKLDKVNGSLKVGYDDKKLSSSIKYIIHEKKTFLNAGYKYKNNDFNYKVNSEIELKSLEFNKMNLLNEFRYTFDKKTNTMIKLDTKFNSLKQIRFDFENEINHKYDDKLDFKNELKLAKSAGSYKGEIEVPEFIKPKKIKSDDINLFMVRDKISSVYKLTDEVKLTSSAYLGYESRKTHLDKLKINEKQNIMDFNENRNEWKLLTEFKLNYNSKHIKGLKSNIQLKYTYQNILDSLQTKKSKGTIESNIDTFEVNAGATYDKNINKNFKFTPFINLEYTHSLAKYLITEKKNGTLQLEKQKLIIKPDIKLSYKYNKITTSLGVEMPFEFEGKKYTDNNTKDLKEIKPYLNISKNEKFAFKKAKLKATLSLKYSW